MNSTITDEKDKTPILDGRNNKIQKIVSVLAVIFCLTPLASPPIALAIGINLALTIGHPHIHLNS